MGPPRDHDEAVAVVRRARELGVDHIDTASYYGPDVANEYPGRGAAPVARGPADRLQGRRPPRRARRVAARAWRPTTSARRSRPTSGCSASSAHRRQPPRPRHPRGRLRRRARHADRPARRGQDRADRPEQRRRPPARARARAARTSPASRTIRRPGPRRRGRARGDCASAASPTSPSSRSARPSAPRRGRRRTPDPAHRRRGRRDAVPGRPGWLLHHDPHVLLIPGTSSLAHLEENLAAAASRSTTRTWPRWTVSRPVAVPRWLLRRGDAGGVDHAGVPSPSATSCPTCGAPRPPDGSPCPACTLPTAPRRRAGRPARGGRGATCCSGCWAAARQGGLARARPDARPPRGAVAGEGRRGRGARAGPPGGAADGPARRPPAGGARSTT